MSFIFLLRLNLFNTLVKVLIISIQQYKKYKTGVDFYYINTKCMTTYSTSYGQR